MSKSTKPSRSKKGMKNKTLSNPLDDTPAPVAALPSEQKAVAVPKLEREDQLILQLAYSELQNKQYQLRDAQRVMEEANTNWAKQLEGINQKYKLDSKKDKIDLGTGVIQKG